MVFCIQTTSFSLAPNVTIIQTISKSYPDHTPDKITVSEARWTQRTVTSTSTTFDWPDWTWWHWGTCLPSRPARREWGPRRKSWARHRVPEGRRRTPGRATSGRSSPSTLPGSPGCWAAWTVTRRRCCSRRQSLILCEPMDIVMYNCKNKMFMCMLLMDRRPRKRLKPLKKKADAQDASISVYLSTII